MSRLFHERLTHKIMSNIIIEANIKCMIDAGGWLGDTATKLAENNPEIKIITIEPSLENCNFIRKYIKQHNLKNVKVLNNCLSAYKDHKFSTTSSSIFSNKQYNKSKEGINSITIDSISKNNSDLGLIHLDVEGMEYECLKGAYNSIKKKDIIFIIEILEKNKYKQQIINLFKNYNIYIIPESVGPVAGNNYIFFHKKYTKINIEDFVRKYRLRKI